jgi:hypothetical protein
MASTNTVQRLPIGVVELVDAEGTTIAVLDGPNRTVRLPAGTTSITPLADGTILIGTSAGAGAAKTLTGDVTMTREGVTAIGAAKVTGAMLANGAGVAAILTAGLGGSHSSPNTEAATTTIIAAHATKARACLVVVVITETYATGTGTQPTLKVGEDDTVEAAFAAATIAGKTAGTVLVGAFTKSSPRRRPRWAMPPAPRPSPS